MVYASFSATLCDLPSPQTANFACNTFKLSEKLTKGYIILSAKFPEPAGIVVAFAGSDGDGDFAAAPDGDFPHSNLLRKVAELNETYPSKQIPQL